MQVASGLQVKWERSPPPLLYHYTSQDGLLGILESKNIWASKIQYLNDYKEFKLGLEISRELAKRKQSSEPSLSSLVENLQRIEKTNVCVCSFSEEGDLLSQWRGYCPQGAGFSIGFDSQQLRFLADKQNFLLGPCEYGVEVQKSLLESVIDTEIRKFSNTEIEEASARLARLIAVYSAAMKHHSFSEEREWRLVSGMIKSTHPQFGFRKGQSVIVPYFRFSLVNGVEPLPIRRVIIGPTPHPDLALDSVSMLLACKGIKGGKSRTQISLTGTGKLSSRRFIRSLEGRR